MSQLKRSVAFVVFIAVVLGGVVGGVLGFRFLQRLFHPNALVAAARHVPADVDVVLAAQQLGAVATAVKELGESSATPAERDALRKQAIEKLGFDPLDPDAWKQSGVDGTKPWLLAMKGTNA